MASVKEFHDAVCCGEYERARALLSMDKKLVNALNEEGMTPLDQACFKGNRDVVEYLLKNGADVNSREHKQGYTSLMFAALAGHMDVIEMLLQHGARISYTNKLGRTASQMASFVGNHRVVTLINNFIPREEVDHYTQVSVSAKLRISTEVASTLYRLILSINFSPVHVLRVLSADLVKHSGSSESSILLCWPAVVNVLEDLLANYFTPHQTHEALALKFHLLACCIRRAGTYNEDASENTETKERRANCEKNLNKPTEPLHGLLRDFLRGTDPHGLPLGQEKFLRQSLMSFPHPHSTLWQCTVRQISPVKPGMAPTALAILTQAINGQGLSMPMGDVSNEPCAACNEQPNPSTVIMLCSNCKEVGYCSVACQRLHWFTHKKYCPILKAHHESVERSRTEIKDNKT
ncbi:Ankyrin repeat and MYND domain-containing protein 2 [Fasciola hepatica]|uniref:Ankyrin repeat and MYND domain-containing protein 2 n=1 Tax=Fasciola hepatica TaxID=6192 RepID=A0A4E0RAU3_FASHE|nr:Ankyrin repeat and MYND domain-containing protein 2 [Fasciola hepatica]